MDVESKHISHMSAQEHFLVSPNFPSITQLFHQCSQTKNGKAIKQFHGHLLRTGLLFFSSNLQTQLVFAYASCLSSDFIGTLPNLLKIFNLKNPLPFNSILSHFSQFGHHSLAIRTFAFIHFNGVHIDSYALCSALGSSCAEKNTSAGKKIHALIKKSGWLSSVFVGSALIDLYAKSLDTRDARMVFDEIPVKNTVCVNTLLSGYAEAKMWSHGLSLVRQMPILNLGPDNITFSAALRSCTGLSSVAQGKQIHASILRNVWDLGDDVFLQSLLIEMYGKCGHIQKAKQIFKMEREINRDVILWTSMLGVYGKNGNFDKVIALFKDMLTEGIKPDGVAFLIVLSACSHSGEVDLGFQYFEAMVRVFGLEQTPEHYSCLVDALCRAGELDKAWNFINGISLKGKTSNTISMWGALLNACSECGNVDFGKLAAQKALDLDPENVGIRVLLSNMYASHGIWNELEQLRESMNGRNLKKDIGCSWIEE